MNPSAPIGSTPSGTLAQALRRGQATLDAEMPPPGLQAATLAAARAAVQARSGRAAQAAHTPPARTGWPRRGAMPAFTAFAAFASLAFTGVTVLWLLQPGLPAASSEPAAARLPEGFVAVAPPERWPAGPSSGWLVPTELGRDRLAALGLPFDPGRAAERLPAELLLAPSGEVLAVRLQTVAMR